MLSLAMIALQVPEPDHVVAGFCRTCAGGWSPRVARRIGVRTLGDHSAAAFAIEYSGGFVSLRVDALDSTA